MGIKIRVSKMKVTVFITMIRKLLNLLSRGRTLWMMRSRGKIGDVDTSQLEQELKIISLILTFLQINQWQIIERKIRYKSRILRFKKVLRKIISKRIVRIRTNLVTNLNKSKTKFKPNTAKLNSNPKEKTRTWTKYHQTTSSGV